MELIDRMREGRKSPQVLRIKLVAIRSARPDLYVFFFESIDDVGVYEDWLSRIPGVPAYEAVPGKGKEQLLALQIMLEAEGDLGDCWFFVDGDFDAEESYRNVFIADAYSIENLLCDVSSLDSLLINEFRCAGDPGERTAVTDAFLKIMERVRVALEPVNEVLFLARRNGIRVERKPDHVRDMIDVGLDSVSTKFDGVHEVINASVDVEDLGFAGEREEFRSLSLERCQRGKYVMQAFRLWLARLAEDRRSGRPVLFIRSIPNLPGSPDQVPLRRLASATTPPRGLAAFVGGIPRKAA